MTKLKDTEFREKMYVTECEMSEVSEIMALRLNMIELDYNYGEKYVQSMLCAKHVEEKKKVQNSREIMENDGK